MKTSRFAATSAFFIAALLTLSPLRADEFQSLPPAIDDTKAQEAQASMESQEASEKNALANPPNPLRNRIESDVPSYTERGIVMVPLRPLARFLGLRIRNLLGVIVVESAAKNGIGVETRLMLRNGSAKAQTEKNGTMRVLALPLAMQTRLGNAFVPARSVAAVFGATAQAVPEENGVLIGFAGQKVLFGSIAQNGYRGDDAARVVIENNVGKALSLHLSGPQSVRIELGPRARITRNLRPGVYRFRAASSGMKTRNGVRRFVVKQRATWNWGRK